MHLHAIHTMHTVTHSHTHMRTPTQHQHMTILRQSPLYSRHAPNSTCGCMCVYYADSSGHHSHEWLTWRFKGVVLIPSIWKWKVCSACNIQGMLSLMGGTVYAYEGNRMQPACSGLQLCTGSQSHALGYSCVQEVNHMLWVTYSCELRSWLNLRTLGPVFTSLY